FFALLFLVAFSLVRLEAPLFAIVILLVATFREGWSYTDRLKLIIPFTLIFLGWYARVYFILPERPDLLTKRLVSVFSFVLFAFGMFAVVSGLKAFAWVIRRTPFLTLAGLTVLSIIFTILKPEHMVSSLESIAWNTLLKGNWGLTWYVL